MKTITVTEDALRMLTDAPCTLDDIRFYEVAETRYTVDATGRPQQELNTAPTQRTFTQALQLRASRFRL